MLAVRTERASPSSRNMSEGEWTLELSVNVDSEWWREGDAWMLSRVARCDGAGRWMSEKGEIESSSSSSSMYDCPDSSNSLERVIVSKPVDVVYRDAWRPNGLTGSPVETELVAKLRRELARVTPLADRATKTDVPVAFCFMTWSLYASVEDAASADS